MAEAFGMRVTNWWRPSPSRRSSPGPRSWCAGIPALNRSMISAARRSWCCPATNEQALKAHVEQKRMNTRILNVRGHAEALLTMETDRADAYGSDDVRGRPDKQDVVICLVRQGCRSLSNGALRL